MDSPKVYIAGVGCSQIEAVKALGDQGKRFSSALVATTKALLDAGITYTDVGHSVTCLLDEGPRVPRDIFSSFGMTGASVSEVDGYSALFTTIQCVRSGRAECALLVGFDTEAPASKQKQGENGIAIAIVVVSERFLSSRAFLKDSAILIRATAVTNPIYSREKGGVDDTRTTKQVLNQALRVAGLKSTQIQILEMRPKSNLTLRHAFGDFRQTDTKVSSKSLSGFSGSIGLAGLCEIVWQLRGWAGKQSVSQAKNALQFTAGPDQTSSAIILGRSDGKAVPQWKTIEHLRDGRERLFHNPALENKDITLEDWEAVKADDAFLPKDAVENLKLESRGGDRAALARLQPQAKL